MGCSHSSSRTNFDLTSENKVTETKVDETFKVESTEVELPCKQQSDVRAGFNLINEPAVNVPVQLVEFASAVALVSLDKLETVNAESKEEAAQASQVLVNSRCEPVEPKRVENKYVTDLEIANSDEEDEDVDPAAPVAVLDASTADSHAPEPEEEKRFCKRIESISPALPPPLMQGFLLKLGHVHKNWKNRYFVVMNGELRYFQIPSNTPPYGVNLKGECLHLERYALVADKTQIPAAVQPQLDSRHPYYIYLHAPALAPEVGTPAAPKNMYPELVLHCMNEEVHHVWCAALTCHIRYKHRISTAQQ